MDIKDYNDDMQFLLGIILRRLYSVAIDTECYNTYDCIKNLDGAECIKLSSLKNLLSKDYQTAIGILLSFYIFLGSENFESEKFYINGLGVTVPTTKKEFFIPGMINEDGIAKISDEEYYNNDSGENLADKEIFKIEFDKTKISENMFDNCVLYNLSGLTISNSENKQPFSTNYTDFLPNWAKNEDKPQIVLPGGFQRLSDFIDSYAFKYNKYQ